MNRSLVSELEPLCSISAFGPFKTPKLKSLGKAWIGAFALCSLLPMAQAQTNYQRLFSFGMITGSGGSPSSTLVEAPQGVLYGMAGTGGPHYAGTLFKMDFDGSDFTLLRSFTNGPFPHGGLLLAADETLYGTRSGGGSNNLGCIFKVDTNGNNYSIMHSFAGPTHGADGATPDAGLIQGADGALYGTTQEGGTANLGTVFKLNPDGNGYRVLYSFTGTTNGDGSSPFGALVQGGNGMLYGTTQTGGSNNLGTVFELDTNGNHYAVLHHFTGSNGDGATPYAELIQGRDGALYGTTQAGGTNKNGTVFRLDTDGQSYTILHNFDSSGDGQAPWGGLVQGNDGVLRGTTRFGGSNGVGTLFALNTNGDNYRVLHNFSTSNGDGYQPLTSLLSGSDGNWYGATYYGGETGKGALFRLLATPPRIRITWIQPEGTNVFLNFAGGAAGQLYQIEATTNLADVSGWIPIGSTNAAIDGSFQFKDSDASRFPVRFYRSAMP